jgi:hypothetical protein
VNPVIEFLMEHETIAKAVAAIWYGGAAVVVFLVVTRRGWWNPTGPEVDWTTTADCPRCNEHGPFFEASADLLSSQERARDLHQGWHEIASVLLPPLARVMR